jgi:hypothetical protein
MISKDFKERSRGQSCFMPYLLGLCSLTTVWAQGPAHGEGGPPVDLGSTQIQGVRSAERSAAGSRVLQIDSLPGVQGATLWQALQQVPGIESDGSGGLLLRGQPLQVEIEGLPVRGTLEDALSALPAEKFKEIEVRSVADARTRSSQTGGVLRVRRTSGSTEMGSMQLGGAWPLGGNFALRQQGGWMGEGRSLDLDWMSRKFDGRFDVERSYEDPLGDGRGVVAEEEVRKNTMEIQMVSIGLRQSLPKLWSAPVIQLDWRGVEHARRGDFSKSEFYSALRTDSLQNSESMVSGTESSRNWRNRVGTSLQGRLGQKLQWNYQTALEASWLDEVTEGSLAPQSKPNGTDQQWTTSNTLTLPVEAWKFALGVESWMQQSEQSRSSDGAEVQDTAWQEDRQGGALWFQPEWTSERSSFVLGLRLEADHSDTDGLRWDLVPNSAYEWTAPQGWTTSLAAATRLKRPDARDRSPIPQWMGNGAWRVGNPDLVSELQHVLEWQIDAKPVRQGLTWQVSAQARWTQDPLWRWRGKSDTAWVMTQVNAPDQWQAGTGLNLSYKAVLWSAGIDSRLTWFEDAQAPQELPSFLQDWGLRSSGETVSGGWWPSVRGRLTLPTLLKGDWTLVGNWAGRRPTNQGWSEQNPTLDLSLRQPLPPILGVRGLAMYARVQDVLDQNARLMHNESAGWIEEAKMQRAGRSMAAGIQWRWGAPNNPNSEAAKANKSKVRSPNQPEDADTGMDF